MLIINHENNGKCSGYNDLVTYFKVQRDFCYQQGKIYYPIFVIYGELNTSKKLWVLYNNGILDYNI